VAHEDLGFNFWNEINLLFISTNLRD
jgi:hypothetical protein